MSYYIQRLDQELRNAGIPIDGVSYDGSFTVAYQASATSQQIAQGESLKANFDFSQTAEDAWVVSQAESTAKSKYTNTDDLGRLFRAVVSLLIDELNTLREWDMSLQAAVAASTSLADLKTRVAALSSLPDRTVGQAATAINNKIDGGA